MAKTHILIYEGFMVKISHDCRGYEFEDDWSSQKSTERKIQAVMIISKI